MLQKHINDFQASKSVLQLTIGKQRLDGKVALVAHAGHGHAKQQAMVLSTLGASVIVADVDVPSAEQTAEEIRALGGKAIAVAIDITVKSQREMLVKYASGIFGGLDILVNSVGAVYALNDFDERNGDKLEELLTHNINASMAINQSRTSGW